jgi:hypothetical protein
MMLVYFDLFFGGGGEWEGKVLAFDNKISFCSKIVQKLSKR